jgi:hypothetical protein
MNMEKCRTGTVDTGRFRMKTLKQTFGTCWSAIAVNCGPAGDTYITAREFKEIKQKNKVDEKRGLEGGTN